MDDAALYDTDTIFYALSERLAHVPKGSLVIFSTACAVENVMEKCRAHQIPLKVLLGSYHGNTETSYLIQAYSATNKVIHDMIKGQACILLLTPKFNGDSQVATLIYLNGLTRGEFYGGPILQLVEKVIGQIAEFTNENKPEDGTYNPDTSIYYGVVPVGTKLGKLELAVH